MNSKILNEKENILKYIDEGKTLKEISEIYGYSKVSKFKNAAIKAAIIPMKNGEYYTPDVKKHICPYCGKEFDSYQKLGGHINFCECNKKRDGNLLLLDKNRNKNGFQEKEKLKCRFCGKEVLGEGCLMLHEKHCHKNPDYVKKIVTPHGKSHTAWNKGKTAETDERILKYINSRRISILDGRYIPKSTKHSEETKEILRRKMIDYVKKNGNGSFGQHYSVKACEYIDKLNEENGWNLQHALNGGEVEVCGYFLDGYDENLNIVFEYDEPKHYENVNENKLKKRDIKRQDIIIKKLNCQFYRYNEKKRLLYKVN